MNGDIRDQLELEHWRLVLGDIQELNERTGAIANELSEIPLACLNAVLLPLEQRGNAVLDASRSARRAGDELLAFYGPINRMLELVGKRVDELAGNAPGHSVRVESDL